MNLELQPILRQVIDAFRDENFNAANVILHEILQGSINNADTIYELGIAYAKANRYTEAASIFCCLQTYKNNDIKILYNLGLVYSMQSKHQLALDAYDLALTIQPDDAELLINKGSTCNDVKNFNLALELLEKAIQIQPNIPEAWFNKGVALDNLNRYEDSISAYNEAIKLGPNYYEAWNNKGITLCKLKRYEEAITHFDKALSLKPEYVEAWSNKGEILHELKRYNEAIAHYDKALSLKPDYAEAWSFKGATLYELKRYNEAIAHYDKALSLKPDYAEALLNKGAALKELKWYEQAIDFANKALAIDPNLAEAWSNKAAALNELKRYDEAITHYEKALCLKPNIDWVYGDLVHAKMKICSWSNLDNAIELISKKVMENEKIAQPFSLLALIDDAQLHKKSAEIYIQSIYPLNPVLGEIKKYSKHEKIRLGYFSADFRNHAVSFLMAELFELHDKNRFEIIAFSTRSGDDSLMRQRLSKAFDQFIDVHNMPDLEVAKLSRKLEIDIAVDLGGFTAESRLGIFALRAAPIQLSYIGYLGTTGATYMDYILSDQTITSDGSEDCFTEKIIRLPSYQVNDSQRKISDKKFTRKELGLPENSFVFCCFNNSYKILPSTFNSWMNILKSCKESVLYLYADNEWVEHNLVKEAEIRGVDGNRLIFGKHLPLDQYLSRYKLCDLFLDTAPYNAGTTASDALWAGLPVLTLVGQSFASRVAASVLNAIDLPELVTTTQAHYEALAIELAHSPEKLATIKSKLEMNRETTLLFNTFKFKNSIESAYQKIYERYQADLKPEHISIF
jgi:protein O-GlcNAc transferase